MGRDIKEPWVSKVRTKDKPWGLESTWNTTSSVSQCKLIHIKAGHRTSLKKYNIKNESLDLVTCLVFLKSGSRARAIFF